MASGFFSGGMAEGMAIADKQALEDRRLTADTGLRTRALDITESSNKADQGLRSRALDITESAGKRVENQAMIERIQKNVSDTMAVVGNTIKEAMAVGRDPAQIEAAVAPLLMNVKPLAAKIGITPDALDAQVKAQLFQPTGIEAAKAGGTAEGTKKGFSQAAEDAVVTAAGGNPSRIKDPKDRVTLEGGLRDDYLKQATPYITIRDAKNRMDGIENSGAGDIALLFQFMKILDPGSTVREGEFATAGSVAGVPGQIEGLRRQLVGGGRLSDAARTQIKSQSDKLYQAAANQHDKLTTTFSNIAKRQGLNPDNVTVNLLPAGAALSTPGGTTFRILQ